MRHTHTTQLPPYSESPKSILKAYEAHEARTHHTTTTILEESKVNSQGIEAHEARTHHTTTTILRESKVDSQGIWSPWGPHTTQTTTIFWEYKVDSQGIPSPWGPHTPHNYVETTRNPIPSLSLELWRWRRWLLRWTAHGSWLGAAVATVTRRGVGESGDDAH